jgi:hypothetical protein
MKNTASEPTKKVTMLLPKALVEEVTRAYNKPLTEIVREVLRAQMSKQASRQLAAMQGKVKLSMTYQELKDLRD